MSVFYPLTPTNTWLYNYTTDDPNALAATGVVGLQVIGTKPVKGVTAAVVHRGDPTHQNGQTDLYFYVSPGGVTNLGNGDTTDVLTPQLVPYVEQKFPVTLGTVSTLTGTGLADGTDTQNHAITVDLTQTIANSSFETIAVPAGTFTNALKQTTTITGTVHDNGQSAPLSGSETAWFVAGVGQVKDQTSATGGSTTIHTNAEARFYEVNNTLRGISSGKQIVGGFIYTAMGVGPLIASDGTNFLIVTQPYDSTGTQQNWTGTVMDATGFVVTPTFNITSPAPAPGSGTPQQAVLGFDGTNYLFVRETEHTGTAQPKTLDALLISPTGTIVAGPNTVGTVVQNTAGPKAEALAFDGTRYLLVYLAGQGQLNAQFITPATAQPDGASLPLEASIGTIDSPAIAYGGGNYLIAWDDNGAAPQEQDVRVARVAPATGTVDATPLLVAQQISAVQNPMTPVVTFDGGNYLVSYRDFRNVSSASSFYARVSAARVSPQLALRDGSAATPGIQVTHGTTTVLGQLSGVFMRGEHWLVWVAGDQNLLYGSRVTAAGAVPGAWSDGFLFMDYNTTTSYPVIAASADGGYATWYLGQPTSVSPFGARIF